MVWCLVCATMLKEMFFDKIYLLVFYAKNVTFFVTMYSDIKSKFVGMAKTKSGVKF